MPKVAELLLQPREIVIFPYQQYVQHEWDLLPFCWAQCSSPSLKIWNEWKKEKSVKKFFSKWIPCNIFCVHKTWVIISSGLILCHIQKQGPNDVDDLIVSNQSTLGCTEAAPIITIPSNMTENNLTFWFHRWNFNLARVVEYILNVFSNNAALATFFQ